MELAFINGTYRDVQQISLDERFNFKPVPVNLLPGTFDLPVNRVYHSFSRAKSTIARPTLPPPPVPTKYDYITIL